MACDLGSSILLCHGRDVLEKQRSTGGVTDWERVSETFLMCCSRGRSVTGTRNDDRILRVVEEGLFRLG